MLQFIEARRYDGDVLCVTFTKPDLTVFSLRDLEGTHRDLIALCHQELKRALRAMVVNLGRVTQGDCRMVSLIIMCQKYVQRRLARIELCGGGDQVMELMNSMKLIPRLFPVIWPSIQDALIQLT